MAVTAINPAFSSTSSAERLIALMATIVARLRHACCAVLRGHEMMTHREPERLSLQCLHCGYTTHGWSIGVEGRYRRTAAPVVPIEDRIRRWSTDRWLQLPRSRHHAA
jgi:hypothetical protein